ncbi:MAG: hypothetical protein DMD89_01070 [Candidatus Rokuibacteriota bacterium]|nr:MAG: hypothetical protein DMD89_01070 [Candidatus Rokubacteria bacterium]
MADVMYAVAIRDDVGLWLLCRVRRSSRGDVYVLFPRSDPDWNPHASYHRDGTRHVRSHGGKYIEDQSQRPDASFRGTESVFALAIQPGEPAMFNTPCDPAEFADVFAIPRRDLPLDEHHTLAVDLVGTWARRIAGAVAGKGAPEVLSRCVTVDSGHAVERNQPGATISLTSTT